MKTKSDPTIKKAVEVAFGTLPDYFRGNDIHRLVKMITRRLFIHTDSSLRKMRMLKAEGKINYEIIGSRENSLYRKL
jgi:hypothetical protein